MKKTSIASLQERLAGWTNWEQAMYQVGACLGFWPEFGAPGDAIGPFDPWHGVKDTVYLRNPLGDAIGYFLNDLIEQGVLELREQPDIELRWKPDYKGHADLISTL